MTEYSRSAKGKFTSTGAAQIINLPFQPNVIRMINYSAATTPAQNGVPFAFWQSGMGQGKGVIEAFNATPVLTTDVISSNGFSTFAAGQMLQFGAKKQVASTTKGNPTTITTAAAHGYTVGQVILLQGLYQSSTTGMPQICGIPFTVLTVPSSTTFTIGWDTSGANYTNLSGSPTGAFVMQVLYPYLYQPGVVFVGGISTGTTTLVGTTTAHNYVVGQEVAFRIPSAYGTVQLNSLPNSTIPGSPIYGYVTAVNSAFAFTVNIDSTNFTTFVANVPVVTGGFSFPQVVAVGDINTGGVAYSGGALYPSPVINGVSTINGPAISGAYVNNTSQGFIIGAGTGTTLTSAVLVGANGNVIYWEAEYVELSIP